MKESEAKRKVCWKDIGHSSCARKCTGSKCMAWQPDFKEERITFNEGEIVPDNYIKMANFKENLTAIRYIELDSVDCGALPIEQGCFAKC